jgi:hypothetical protein
MSITLRYQGLPPSCGFIELVRSRTWTEPCWISAVSHWLRWGIQAGGERIKPMPGRKFPRVDAEAELIWAWCCEAVGRYPGISERSLDLYKWHRWLPFLLSAKVRKSRRWPRPGPTDPRSWNDPESAFDQLVEYAFDGAPQLAPGVCGPQGLETRLIERSTVYDLGTCIEAMECKEVSPRISELVELRGITADDADHAMQLFSEFRRFFSEAAQRGEDVLVIWE